MEETVLQFGTGKFLRSFADLFIHEANAAGREIGRVVAVQSTASDRGSWLNQQRGTYHVLIRGTVGGVEIDDIAAVASISRALVAKFEWDRALEVARSSHLRAIVSNVTEIGYRDDADGDALLDSPPGSFPAKLTAVLWARHRANLPGVTVLPCELIERNGDRLRELVLRVAERWQLGPEFLDWIERECQWANCLVDRIVTGPPQEHELLEGDRLMSVAEPFAFWAVELAGGVCPIEHKAVHVVDDVTPYALRKVRILNGAHTALACKALPLQFETVRQCVTDPEIGPWLEALCQRGDRASARRPSRRRYDNVCGRDVRAFQKSIHRARAVRHRLGTGSQGAGEVDAHLSRVPRALRQGSAHVAQYPRAVYREGTQCLIWKPRASGAMIER